MMMLFLLHLILAVYLTTLYDPRPFVADFAASTSQEFMNYQNMICHLVSFDMFMINT